MFFMCLSRHIRVDSKRSLVKCGRISIFLFLYYKRECSEKLNDHKNRNKNINKIKGCCREEGLKLDKIEN